MDFNGTMKCFIFPVVALWRNWTHCPVSLQIKALKTYVQTIYCMYDVLYTSYRFKTYIVYINRFKTYIIFCIVTIEVIGSIFIEGLWYIAVSTSHLIRRYQLFKTSN